MELRNQQQNKVFTLTRLSYSYKSSWQFTNYCVCVEENHLEREGKFLCYSQTIKILHSVSWWIFNVDHRAKLITLGRKSECPCWTLLPPPKSPKQGPSSTCMGSVTWHVNKSPASHNNGNKHNTLVPGRRGQFDFLLLTCVRASCWETPLNGQTPRIYCTASLSPHSTNTPPPPVVFPHKA